KVTRIQIFPDEVTVDLSDQISFSAVAFDRNDTPVGGVKIKWTGRTSGPNGHVRLSHRGEFEATAPGSVMIFAEGAGKTAQATVVVRPGVRRDLRLPAIGTHEVSTRDVPSTKDGSTGESKRPEGNVAVAAKDQKVIRTSAPRSES